MKTILFNTKFLFALLLTTIVYAQQKDKKERFIVNPDVVIDIDTRYTDVEIQTWNKNEVVVEAFMKVDGEEVTEKTREDLYKKWQFDVYGNSSKINIKSKSNIFIDIHSFNFNNPDYELIVRKDYNTPDVSIYNLDILDSLDFIVVPEHPELPEALMLPELPELPEMPELLPEIPELPQIPTPFDYKAYKKDNSYLERWKKENKDIISENAKIKIGKNSISISSNDNNSSFKWNIKTEGQNQLAEEIEEKVAKQMELREKAYKKRQEAYKIRQEAYKKRSKEYAKRNKERNENRKLAFIKRRELLENRRKEMKALLNQREKIKMKRIVKIKAPKGAKFNMNVRYGSVSFPNK